MRRKIVLSLLFLLGCVAIGTILASLYIEKTTAELDRLVNLHKIEELRKNLVINTQTVQSNLYTVGTPLESSLDTIVENVSHLHDAAQKCLSCHHRPDLVGRLKQIQLHIQDYQRSLSYFITASANIKRIDKLKLDAAYIGNEILVNSEEMSFMASKKLATMTASSLKRMHRAKTILFITIVVTSFLGIFIVARLTIAITRPISELVKATKAISRGELGYSITYHDDTEFGALASTFNKMSQEIEKGYTDLYAEIIERKKTEDALLESKERFALAARGANDGLWDWDIKNNTIYYSPRWKSMLGYEEQEIESTLGAWLNLVHPDDRAQLEAKLSAHINGHSPHFENEYRIVHKNGTYRWMLSRGLAVRNTAGKTHRMAGSQTDITERKTAEEQLLYDAFHDSLTGLPNRALFFDRLNHVISSSHRDKDELYAVLFLDLDRFKVINDSLGHIIGDQLLIEVSQRLAKCLRPGDTIARFGGDEFAVLLENITGMTDVLQIAGRLQEVLPLPFTIDGHEILTTASMGIALSTEGYTRSEEVLRDADLAMYQAKANGKAQYEIFDSRMHSSTLATLQLENDLRHALENNEFVLYYQPIIDLKEEKLIGFEALIRWQHPKRGLIFPMEFIPLAEETGLIFPIGKWIIEEACRQIYEWQKRYPISPFLKVSVNISSKQFSQQDLVQQIAQALEKYCLDSCCLAVEITESMIMNNIESAIDMLNRLKDMGVHIHIDDFGTGYSSLSYLHRFPINALKIDRSFVNKMSNEEELEIIKTIASLAKNLNLDLIAEGVEMADQLSQLKALKCKYGQGYLISKPLDPKTSADFIVKQLELSKTK